MKPGTSVVRWSVNDLEYLRTNFLIKTDAEIAQVLGRTPEAVQTRRNELKLIKPASFSNEYAKKTQFKPGNIPSPNAKRKDGWTEQEDAFLIEHYSTLTAEQIANHLGRTLHATNSRSAQLKIRERKPMASGYKQHKWTDADREFIRANFQKQTCEELAHQLGVSTGSVKNQVKTMKLVKTAESLKKIYSRLPNAGQFRSGENPYNTLEDNVVRIRTNHRTGEQTKYIRLSINNWLPLHQHNWRQAGNEVPDGHVLLFKDGDRMNCEVDNLFLIRRGPHSRKDPVKSARSLEEKIAERELKRTQRHRAREERQLAKLKYKLDKLQVKLEEKAAKLKVKKEKQLATEQKRELRRANRIADRGQQTQQRSEKAAVSITKSSKQLASDKARPSRVKPPAKTKQIRPAKSKKQDDKMERAEQRRREALLRAEQRRQAKAFKERKKLEREAELAKRLPTKAINMDELISVRIDRATTIFIKPGQDPEAAKRRYLERREQQLQSLKREAGN